LVPVSHSFINFDTIVRKIKIDTILNKKILDTEIIHNMDVKNLKNIDDLFLATLILTNHEDQDFITSSTIEKIIVF
jgi:hypothetical protein